MIRIAASIVIAVSIILSAQAGDIINLPSPVTFGGMPVNEAFSLRRSSRNFDPDRSLSTSQISNLLWAAAGINRPESAMRTNPTAMNRQEISVYLFDKNGAWLYDAKANALSLIAAGDHRNIVAGPQSFVEQAPLCLVFVADCAKLGSGDHATMMAAADAGIVSQNVNIHCAGEGLATVTRATMNVDEIRRILKLGDQMLPILNNPVGYELR